MQGQRDQLAGLEMQASNDTLRADVKADVKGQTEAIQSLQAEQRELLQRVQKLEQGTSSGASTIERVSTERHRFTLIFGGWAKDTSRQTITTQLGKALQDLGLAPSTDFPGFTVHNRSSQIGCSYAL